VQKSYNETFISILIQATNSIVRSQQSDKKEAFKNAVINTALGNNIKDETKELFIRYLDELIPSHLLLLSFLLNNEQLLCHKESYEDLYQEFNSKHPDKLNKDEFQMLFGDLSSRGLIRVSSDLQGYKDLSDTILFSDGSSNDFPRFIITSLGKDFIDFITIHDN
jgi:hypothetical protein